MLGLFQETHEENEKGADEIYNIKDTINQTFHIVADLEYKEGIDRVDAAYKTFITNQNLDYFELQMIAEQNLKAEKIGEYLKVIKKNSNNDMCQVVMHYIIIVLSKYLLMMAACHIDKDETD